MRDVPSRAAFVSIAFALVSAATSGQPSTSGTITGHVKLTSHVRGTPLPSNAYEPRSVNRKAASTIPELRNVVVYLKDVTVRGSLPTTHGAITQEHEAFTPRVLPVTRGSSVDFPNADPFFHNVFSLSGAATFDLGRYPQGKTVSRTFSKAGLVKVYCHIHSQMTATILVLDHPYFAVPELDGSFSLPNVPSGRYTIVGWHERVGERTAAVQVEDGGTATVDFSLPVEDGP
jgi:plastocyanin